MDFRVSVGKKLVIGAVSVLVFAGCAHHEHPKPRMEHPTPQVEVTKPKTVAEVPEDKTVAEVPEDKTLYLTVPGMQRVENLPIFNGSPDNEALLGESALHVNSTGFPWEEGANVYIAGHRLGYEGTLSWKVFDDLENLEKGDLIYLWDSMERKYTYRVYEEKVVGPSEVDEMEPVGKDVISLQTCTLPDYTDRYIVRAEKI